MTSATMFYVIPANLGAIILSVLNIIAAIANYLVATYFWVPIKAQTSSGAIKIAYILLILGTICRALFAVAAMVAGLKKHAQAALVAVIIASVGLFLDFIDTCIAATSSNSVDQAALVLMSLCLWIYTNLKMQREIELMLCPSPLLIE